jgi:hypothetical protein
VKDKPDYHDADLVLRLYELRREPVMRASREFMSMKFLPRTWDDFLAVTRPEHPQNAAFRQTATYWEMAFGMARHEIAHAEYLVENCGEGILLYTKVAPFLARFREEFSPHAFRHAEWAATQTAAGRRYLELFQSRLRKMADAAAAAAAAAAATSAAGAAGGR